MKPPNEHSLWHDLKQLPGAYWILFSGTLVNRFGHFVMPFLAIYLKREGYDGWVTGAALAAYGAGGLIANLAGGYLADRIGRKPTIVTSCGTASMAMIALCFASGPTWIIAASGAVGLTSAMYFPAASALLADLVPKPLRIRAFGCQRLAINLGFALGMITAGMLATRSFTLLFFIDAATTTLLGLLVLFGLPRGVRRVPKNAGWPTALKAMKANPAYIRAVIASFCIAAVFWQVSSSWGLHVTQGLGLSPATYGWLMALNGLMIVLFELPLTSFTRKHPEVRAMVIGYALVGIGMGLNLLGGGLTGAAIVVVVFTLGEMIALPVAHSYIASIAPEDMRGRFMGVLGVAWSAATMLGPAAGIALFEYSPDLLWVACLGLGLGAAWCVARTRKASAPVAVPSAIEG
ncbi:MAG: MFS transporter [Verrucomicrobiota bacterium]